MSGRELDRQRTALQGVVTAVRSSAMCFFSKKIQNDGNLIVRSHLAQEGTVFKQRYEMTVHQAIFHLSWKNLEVSSVWPYETQQKRKIYFKHLFLLDTIVVHRNSIACCTFTTGHITSTTQIYTQTYTPGFPLWYSNLPRMDKLLKSPFQNNFTFQFKDVLFFSKTSVRHQISNISSNIVTFSTNNLQKTHCHAHKNSLDATTIQISSLHNAARLTVKGEWYNNEAAYE